MTHKARLGEMRSSVFWCLVSLLVALPTATHAQASLCGNPPPVEDEQLKGDINGKAQFLSHFLGDASLGGKIESSRTEIFSRYKDANERSNAYFEYEVCVILLQDSQMTAAQKIDKLREIRLQFSKPISVTSPPRVSEPTPPSAEADPRSTESQKYSGLYSELRKVSEGDMFLEALFYTADGTEVGDAVDLRLSRRFLTRDFSHVIFEAGSSVACRFNAVHNKRLYGNCDKVILEDGTPIRIKGYLIEPDGSKGVDIREGNPVHNYAGKEIFVRLVPLASFH
jgi:hypothetical protein